MPKLEKIDKVLLIGSGPIVIGQAAEFDYSGAQACRAMREEGVQVVLVNSNPATIQTDLETADIVYIEPLLPEVLEKIIEKEKPDGMVATMAGQTGLNLAVKLRGALAKHGVAVLGTGIDSIELSEDREKFREKMIEIGEPVPQAGRARSLQAGQEVARKIGLPVMVRPDFCLGGTGSAIAHDEKELQSALEAGLRSSASGSVLVEKSLEGMAELEYEIIRDGADNCIAICSMENFDAVGVHTGESIVVAPAQTLAEQDHQKLRSSALKVVRSLGVVGACNIQFALNQQNGEYYIIEVNPRASRSSALASKATGYPIARVATKIALGYTLPEIENRVTGKTACFEPAIDYVVVKIPRWPFDKFRLEGAIGPSMKSTGEAMAIGRTFEEALGKAIRSLELRTYYHSQAEKQGSLAPSELRLFALKSLLAQGRGVGELAAAAQVNPWFVEKLKNIVDVEKRLEGQGINFDSTEGSALLVQAKRIGLPDSRISALCGKSVESIKAARKKLGLAPVFKMVDTCAGEFEALTPYFYSTYEQQPEQVAYSREAEGGKKIIILGAGPIRIGQGIEFDYCTVHAVQALAELGFKTVVVNNNPETVSTDFDVSDRLYFEPLTSEDVLAIVEHESRLCENNGGELLGVMVQFGGQTALNLARALSENGVRVLGTGVDSLEAAGDRKKFISLARKLAIPTVNSGVAYTREEALSLAEYVEFPVLVRPSFVLGGRAMQVAHDRNELERIVDEAIAVSNGHSIVIDHFIADAIEVDVDLLCDGKQTVMAGIMEQVEEAGVHSGDSCTALPSQSISQKALERIRKYCANAAKELAIVGVANVQLMVKGDDVFMLEINPRASRTIPFVSKITGVHVAKIAAALCAGALSIESLNLPQELAPAMPAVKSPVFSFHKFDGLDPLLGAEMKSTGESMGIAPSFQEAFAKAELAAGNRYGRKAVLCHCGKWKKTLAAKLAEAGVEAVFSNSSEESTRLLAKGDAFLVCGLSGGEGMEERALAVRLGVPCITSAFKALAVANCIKELGAAQGGIFGGLEPIRLNDLPHKGREFGWRELRKAKN